MARINNFHRGKIVLLKRKREEKIPEDRHLSAEKSSVKDIDVLLNELQVFQLKLELQNDELKTSYQILEAERTKFAELFDLAPVGYFILDHLGVIEEANQTGTDLLNLSKDTVLHKRFQRFITPESYESFFSFLHKMQNVEGKQTTELKLALPNKQVIYSRLEGIAVPHREDSNVKYYITILDISESRYARKVLQETTERLEMTLKASLTGTWTVNFVNGRVSLDDYSYNVLGIERWEFDGSIKGLIELIHEEDQRKVKQILLNKASDSAEIDIEFRVSTTDKKIKYISAKGHGITDHEEKRYFAGILMDVTERKRLALEAENLRTDRHRMVLSATLTAQEKEREKISRALHDSICQILYGIRLNLQNIQLSNNLKGTFKNINQLLDQVIRETRQISYELTPSVLKDFGFTAGIKEMAQRSSTPQFQIKTNIKNLADKLNPNLQLYLFRIIQELINNCMKHSNASIAEIKVFTENNQLIVEVCDNGTGFVMDMENALKKGSGLRGIKNRIFLLDGNIDFHSTDMGTTVRISLKDSGNLAGIESS